MSPVLALSLVHECYHHLRHLLADGIGCLVAHWDADGASSAALAVLVYGWPDRIRLPSLGSYTPEAIPPEAYQSGGPLLALDYGLGSLYEEVYARTTCGLAVVDHHETRGTWETRGRLDAVYCNIQQATGVRLSASATLLAVSTREPGRREAELAAVGLAGDYEEEARNIATEAAKTLPTLGRLAGVDWQYVQEAARTLNMIRVDPMDAERLFQKAVELLATDGVLACAEELGWVRRRAEEELEKLEERIAFEEEHGVFIAYARHWMLLASQLSRRLARRLGRLVVLDYWCESLGRGFIYVRPVDDAQGLLDQLKRVLPDGVEAGGRRGVVALEYSDSGLWRRLAQQVAEVAAGWLGGC